MMRARRIVSPRAAPRPPGARIVLGVLCGVLGGCAVGPRYERPDDMIPVEQYRAVLEPQTAESMADLPWASVPPSRTVR